MLNASIFVDLNSPQAVAYPTLALAVRSGKMFVCCYVAIACYSLFSFQIDGLGHFLFGLALAPLILSLVGKPCCTGMELRV